MNPDKFAAWFPLIRDGIIVAVATFMLVYSTFLKQPNSLIIGAGLTLLGIPAAIRLDVWRRNGDEK